MPVCWFDDIDQVTANGWGRQDWLWVIALLVVASVLRLPGLASAPPGLQFDETFNALDALRVVEGARPVFLPSNAGREPLYTYWQTPFVALWGPTATALRLASALPGIATVLLLYVFVRLLFPEEGRQLAGLAALCLALSYWHLHFSRYGIRSILIPFWVLPTLAALWLGLRSGNKCYFLACGLGLAAMIWTHPLGRLMPVVVVFSVGYMALVDHRYAKRHLLGLVVAGVAMLLLLLPLGHYFWKHSDQFLGHTSDVSVFNSRVHRGDMAGALLQNVVSVLGMFAFQGDREWLHNLPGRPALDPLLSIAFVVGLLAVGRRLLKRGDRCVERGRWLLLSVWLVVLLIPSTLSDMAPNFSRAIGVTPVVALITALGLIQGEQWLKDVGRPCLARCLLAAIILISVSCTASDYFWRFARHPTAFYHYDGDKMDVAAFLRQESARNTLFLAPLWANHPTIRLLTRDLDIRSVETNAAVVFPAQENLKAVLYAFPPEQEGNASNLALDWGDWGQRSLAYDSQGHVLLHLFRFAASHRPAMGEGTAFVSDLATHLPTLEGSPHSFGPGLRLLGHQVAPNVSAEYGMEAILVWEAWEPMAADYTCFVHLTDEHGRRWGQADVWPGAGSYATSNWHQGDVIVDRVSFGVDPCLPTGPHRLEVGWYHLASGEQLQTPSGGLSARLATLDLGPLPGTALAELPAPERMDYWPSNGLQLYGFDLPEALVEVGRPFPIALYWRTSAQAAEPVTILVQLKDSASTFPLATVVLPEPETGDLQNLSRPSGLAHCCALRLRLGPAPEGSYRLNLEAVGATERNLDVSTVQVVSSSREYTVPPMDIVLQQDLGDDIRLLGCSFSGTHATTDGSVFVGAGNSLGLTLYWQLLRPVQTGYTVFTHVVHEEGGFAGQNDSVPVKGTYPTTEWVDSEVVADPLEIALGDDARPGRHHLEVGLYDAATGKRLPVTHEGQETGEDRVLIPVDVIVE